MASVRYNPWFLRAFRAWFVVLLALFAYGVVRPTSLADLTGWDTGPAERLAALVAGVVAFFLGTFAVEKAVATRRLFGRLPLDLARHTARLDRAGAYRDGRVATALNYLLMGVGAATVGLYTSWVVALPFAALILVAAAGDFENRFRPPAVMFLANSSREAVALQLVIRSAIHPHRVVSLLNLDAAVDRHATFAHAGLVGDLFRTADDGVWREAVDTFCRAAPVVVIDARVRTPHVVYEVRRLFAAGHAHKTLFLVDDAGGAAALEQALAEMDPAEVERFLIVKEDLLPHVLKYLTRTADRLPHPGRGMKASLAPGVVEAALARRTAADVFRSAWDWVVVVGAALGAPLAGEWVTGGPGGAVAGGAVGLLVWASVCPRRWPRLPTLLVVAAVAAAVVGVTVWRARGY